MTKERTTRWPVTIGPLILCMGCVQPLVLPTLSPYSLEHDLGRNVCIDYPFVSETCGAQRDKSKYVCSDSKARGDYAVRESDVLVFRQTGAPQQVTWAGFLRQDGEEVELVSPGFEVETLQVERRILQAFAEIANTNSLSWRAPSADPSMWTLGSIAAGLCRGSGGCDESLVGCVDLQPRWDITIQPGDPIQISRFARQDLGFVENRKKSAVEAENVAEAEAEAAVKSSFSEVLEVVEDRLSLEVDPDGYLRIPLPDHFYQHLYDNSEPRSRMYDMQIGRAHFRVFAAGLTTSELAHCLTEQTCGFTTMAAPAPYLSGVRYAVDPGPDIARWRLSFEGQAVAWRPLQPGLTISEGLRAAWREERGFAPTYAVYVVVVPTRARPDGPGRNDDPFCGYYDQRYDWDNPGQGSNNVLDRVMILAGDRIFVSGTPPLNTIQGKPIKCEDASDGTNTD